MKKAHTFGTACSVLALALSGSLVAQEQSTENSANVLEEVTVLATKREQTLAEVPIAVSVVSAEVIREAQINDVMDLQFSVPSLRVSQLQTSGQTTFIIRGFGNGANNPGIEPSVGVFIDGVYRSRTASAINDIPNVDRIEVLRGPQSTLFGKNASAGVINVVTAKPNLEEYEGNASVTIGNYNSLIVRGDISGPITDTLGWSLGFFSNQRDGYFENLETGTMLNDRDRWGVRGQLLWEPTDSMSFRLILDSDELDEICCGVANLVDGPTGAAIRLIGGELVPNAPFAYANYYDFDPTNKIDNSGVSLQADFYFKNEMLLTSITSYREHNRVDDVDVDFTSARMVGINDGDTSIDTFTQELRLSQSTDNVDWMVGLYYFDEDVRYDNEIAYDVDFRPYGDILSAGGVTQLENTMKALGLLPPQVSFYGAGQGTLDFSDQKDETISFFGQADWHITDRWTLTGGLNYTKVEKEASVNQINTDIFSAVDMVQVGFGAGFFGLTGLPPTPENIFNNPQAAAVAAQLSQIPCSAETGPACNPLLDFQQFQFLPPFVDFPNSVEPGLSDDSKTTWTLRAAFQATDNINLYASAATGFKATSWNLSRDSRPFQEDLAALYAAGLGVPNLTAGTRYAGPEESTAYEIGFKGNWSTANLYIALFDQEIKGFQSNIFTGTGFNLANAGKQSTKGLEIDSTWVPNESWRLTFSGTFLDPVYDDFKFGNGVDGVEDLSGTMPAGIAETSIVASGTYYFFLGQTTGFLRGEYLYESEVQAVENVPAEVASRKVSTFNASLGFAWDNGLEVILWGRNINNDEYLQTAFPTVAQSGSYSGYPNQPRTYGVTLRASF